MEAMNETFVDKYSEKRQRRHTKKNGTKVKREKDTLCQVFSKAISDYFGKKVKEIRIKKGISLRDLAFLSGIELGPHGKERIYAIENNTRDNGVRLGTIYSIALALDVPVSDLIPTKDEAAKLAGVRFVGVKTLVVEDATGC